MHCVQHGESTRFQGADTDPLDMSDLYAVFD
jgi:hypothetical protein